MAARAIPGMKKISRTERATMRQVFVAFGVVLTVAACSSSGSTAAPSSPASKSSIAGDSGTHDYGSPSAVISALARKNVACVSPSAEPIGPQARSYVEKATACKVGGERVDIAWFATAQQRGQYLKIGLEGTGAYPHFVLGTTWAVAALTRATASKISAAIGGKVY